MKAAWRTDTPTESKICLATVDCGRYRTVVRALYAPKFTVEQNWENDWVDYDEEKDEFFLPEGWYEWNLNEETHWFVDQPVLGWTELPEPMEPTE